MDEATDSAKQCLLEKEDYPFDKLEDGLEAQSKTALALSDRPVAPKRPLLNPLSFSLQGQIGVHYLYCG